MSIRIQGTTIIDDSRNGLSFNTISLTNSSPLTFTTTSTAVLDHSSNSTPVAFRMNKGGSSFSNGSNFGVLQLSRTNHSNSATSAGGALYFVLKDNNGTSREYAGIYGRKTGAGASGGELVFMNYGRNEVGYCNASLLSHTSSVRGPIFYDSNNTGFYADPASTSLMNAIRGYVTTSNTDGQNNYPFRLSIDYNAYMVATAGNTWGLFWAGNSGARYGTNGRGGPGNVWGNVGNPNEFCFVGGDSTRWTVHGNTGHTWQSGYGLSANSFRAPIFYDSNDTGRYVDPASNSELNEVYIRGWFRNRTSGRGLYNQSTGRHFYSPGSSYWHLDGGSSAGGLILYDRYNGSQGNATGRRGYVYYDSNGFGMLHSGGSWWLNTPNNDAFLIIGGYQGLNAYNSVTGRRLMFGGGNSDARSNYYIGTNLENYGGNYNKLDLRWHTGIRMGAQPSYGGIRFYDTEDLGTEIFAIGKSGNFVQAAYSVRGPIFYDSNNTGYYVDPASTTRVNEFRAFRYYDDGGNFLFRRGSSSGSTNHINLANSTADPSRVVGEGAGTGISWGQRTDSQPYYMIRMSYRNFGRSTYTKLTCNWHTGLVFGANAAYGGIRFYSDAFPISQTLNFHINGGSNYTYKYTWMYTNTTGFYSDTNGWHIEPNGLSSYGSMRLRGSRNGWYGHVIDTGNRPHLMFDSSGNGGFYHQDGGRWSFYYRYSNNCVGMIGSSTSSSYGLYVSKSIYSTGNVVAYSDRRKKENIITIDSPLEKINNLRGVYYNRIDQEDAKREVGVIAQEVNEVLPEVVTYAEDVDEYGVSYGNFAGLFIEAIKEQNKIIESMRQEISELKEKIGEQ